MSDDERRYVSVEEAATRLGVSDSFDADQNISGGVRYLSQLLVRFKNDTRLAVAAYNAGPGRVARAARAVARSDPADR